MEQKERTKKLIDILNIVELAERERVIVGAHTMKLNTLKEEIRGLMAEVDLTKLSNEKYDLSVITPITIDTELLKSFKDLSPENYMTKEIKVTYKVSAANKQKLEEKHPEIYQQVAVPGTPRVTIKNLIAKQKAAEYIESEAYLND